MKQIVWTLLLVFFWSNCFAQRVFVKGKVIEKESGEAVVGAIVYLENKSQGTTTDQYGHFVLSGLAGSFDIICSYPGYDRFSLSTILKRDTSLIIDLVSTTLEEIVIKETMPNRQAGFLNIPVSKLKKLPMLLGESDILKALAMTPGVMTGQEGTSGLYVRGSSPDQNLVLLDEAPMYNTSHGFGFLSVFNPDVVKNVDLYKGSFPARFGGRTASVIDLTMKEGSNQKKKKELSLGAINSRFLSEGPIIKNRSSYLIAGRLMHTALLQLPKHIKLVTGKSVQDFVSFWLYDLNAKANYIFNDKSQLFFSIYSNYDFFKNASQRNDVRNSSLLKWGSMTSSLRYNRTLLPTLSWRIIGTYSRFNYQMQTYEERKTKDETITNQFSLDNSIRDWGIKTVIEYTPSNDYTVQLGVDHIFHRYFPGQIRATLDNKPSAISANNNSPIYTQESAFYTENNWKKGNTHLSAGVRYSILNVDNHIYSNWEPRIAYTWSISQAHSIKMGYSRMQQYMHQLTSNGVGLPNDIWVPATLSVPPIRSNQADIGWYYVLDTKNIWQLSIESYYKKMSDLVDYQYGSDIIVDYQKNWQDIVISGVQGKSFGIELMLQKKQGKWNGWISYTYAKSERQTPQINNGLWYASRYDRRHNIALIANYQLTSKWSFVANWVFQTGYPVTLPSAAYIDYLGNLSPYYEGRNHSRMPNFHRLDLGAIYRSKNNKGREFGWNFGFYNAYNRSNPYYLEVIRNYQKVDEMLEITRLSVVKKALFPILPYFSYQIYF
ncbi:TonB-dependent receptor [Runella aurantiaca]|uniref:TonB-dependent receptor n=1 Tax=Runella aurantiaca TaxID=2282308 RepID=A0A369IBC5_9BACT|nr:TonB-dependent receptor [Runella aurantiaca]RDB06938.1 TonB-dependent receptor [Runella aurantiaca]